VSQTFPSWLAPTGDLLKYDVGLFSFNRNFVCEFFQVWRRIPRVDIANLINESAAGAILAYGFVDEGAEFAAR
jgi:hypothetical protein